MVRVLLIALLAMTMMDFVFSISQDFVQELHAASNDANAFSGRLGKTARARTLFDWKSRIALDDSAQIPSKQTKINAATEVLEVGRQWQCGFWAVTMRDGTGRSFSGRQ